MIPQWIKCFFLPYHEFYIIKKLSECSNLVGCKSCKKLFAMNNDVKVILPWDASFEEFYIFMKKIDRQLDTKVGE